MVCGNALVRLHNEMLPREHSDNREHGHSYIVGGARVSGKGHLPKFLGSKCHGGRIVVLDFQDSANVALQ